MKETKASERLEQSEGEPAATSEGDYEVSVHLPLPLLSVEWTFKVMSTNMSPCRAVVSLLILGTLPEKP